MQKLKPPSKGMEFSWQMFSNRLDQSQMFGRIGVFCSLGVASWFRGHEIQHGVGFLWKSRSFLRRFSSWFWEVESQKKTQKKQSFLNKKVRVEQAVPFQQFLLYIPSPRKQLWCLGSRDLQLQDPTHLSNKKKLPERSQDAKSSNMDTKNDDLS